MFSRRSRSHIRGLQPMSTRPFPIALFRIGHLVATPNALDRIPNEDIMRAIQRHMAGDWGDVDDHDRQANDSALIQGSRLLSVYRSSAGERFWIITESDRLATTILLPEDY